MLCWLKPHSRSGLASQAMQSRMSRGIPIPKCLCHNNSIYLFVNGQQIFFFPTESHCFRVSNIILLSGAPTCLFLSGTESKIFLSWHFQESYPVTWAVSAMWRHREKETVRKPGTKVSNCFHSTTEWAQHHSKPPSWRKHWSKNSHERR